MALNFGRYASGEKLSELALSINQEVAGSWRYGEHFYEPRFPVDDIADGKADTVRPMAVKLLSDLAVKAVYPDFGDIPEQAVLAEIDENESLIGDYVVTVDNVEIQKHGHLVLLLSPESHRAVIADRQEVCNTLDFLADTHRIPRVGTWTKKYAAELTIGYFTDPTAPGDTYHVKRNRSQALFMAFQAVRDGMPVILEDLETFERGDMLVKPPQPDDLA